VTTVRINVEIANRLAVVAQVLGISRNKFMSQAVAELVLIHEGDPEYQQKRREWIENLAKVGA
jgi:predicted transcriptional regulator